jgi:putative transcriptional regulator
MNSKSNPIHDSLAEAVDGLERITSGSMALRVTEIELPSAVDVRLIRDDLNMTQQQFAETFGLTVATIRNWEQKKREPEQTAKVFLALIRDKPRQIARAISDLQLPGKKSGTIGSDEHN